MRSNKNRLSTSGPRFPPASAIMMKLDVSPRTAIAGWLFLTWMNLFLVALPASAMTTKILLIGDSLSAGYGLEGPGWVELVNQQFARGGHGIHIVNDSISGDTTAGGLARIADGILRTAPDWVLIELGGNDGLRGIRPRVIEDHLRQMVEIAASRGVRAMLLGIRIPPNYGEAYTTRFERAYENVSADTGVPLLPFFIGELALDPEYMQPDMIHPNDAAQSLIRDRVAPFLLSALGG